MKRFDVSELVGGGAGPVVAAMAPGYQVERGGITRYEVGERSHPEGRHTHTVPEVFVIMQGSGVIEIDGSAQAFEAGDVFVVEPGEDHHLVSYGDVPLLSAWMHLTPVGD